MQAVQVLRAARPAGRVAVRACSAAVRAFSTKKNDDSMSTGDITKYFLDLDSKTAKEVGSTLPIKVSGRVGELVAQLYEAGTKGKNFDKLVKEVEAFVAAVQSGGLVVDRFFSTANYSPEECKKVLETLLTTKESLASFKDIKDAEVKDVLVDNEGNLDAWKSVRKAVQSIGLSDATKELLNTMAAEAHLNRIKKVAVVAAELRAVAAKTVDAVVTSAVPLSKAQQEAVKSALPAYAPSGQTVSISFAVDPAVLGGLLITMSNTTIDLSATSRLVEVVSAQQLA